MMVVENYNSIQVRQQCLRCTYTMFELKNTDFLWVCATFSKSIQFLANFTIGITGNEKGHLLECLEIFRKLINKSET